MGTSGNGGKADQAKIVTVMTRKIGAGLQNGPTVLGKVRLRQILLRVAAPGPPIIDPVRRKQAQEVQQLHLRITLSLLA